MAETNRRPLGKSGLSVQAIGVGTNRWSLGANDAPVFETYEAFTHAGGDFIDTAEVYGFGKSERLIGDCLRRDPQFVVLASKFAPFVARTSPRHLLAALDASLARLGRESLDLYYVHFPFPFTNLDALADAMVEAVRTGRIRAVGVSNFSAEMMRRFADRLAKADIPLAANEVHYSLSNRKAETNGVLDACRELDVALVAYFPLASGRLTGPTPAKDPKTEGLHHWLSDIAEEHPQATPAQVALNWLLARDAHIIPIPGATKARNAKANLAALDWSLTPEQFASLDAASRPIA